MKQFIKDYFYFNKTEGRGIFILLAVLFLLIISPVVVRHLPDKENFSYSEFEKEIIAFEQNQVIEKHYDNNTQNYIKHTVIKENINLTPFYFNPNNLSEEKWKELGLKDKQIKTIKNYEAKGGKFYSKEDLKKIYNISESEYAILEPYIVIDNNQKHYTENKKEHQKENVIVELNSSDSTELTRIKGIGHSFALRILKYRELLGGYTDVKQLSEVYGVDSIKFRQIAPFFTVNKQLVKKININTATFKDMNNHPYINYNTAVALFNYRQKHGNFKDVAEIKKCKLIKEALFEKLYPYLSV